MRLLVVFPNFDRHHGETAKKRALTLKKGWQSSVTHEAFTKNALEERRIEKRMAICLVGLSSPNLELKRKSTSTRNERPGGPLPPGNA